MLPQFEVAFFPSQIFWLIVCFGIFYVFIKYSFLPKITHILEKREMKIKSDMHFYKHNIEEIAALKKENEKMILEAKKESEECLKETTVSMQKFVDEKIVEVEKTMSVKFESAKSEIHDEIAKVKQNINSEALKVAMNILEKIEKDVPSQSEVEKYIS